MRTALCTLAFLLSIPWSLNGYLTTSQKNIEINSGEDATGKSDYTIDSGAKNVVSLSARIQTLHLTSHTEHQGIKLSFRLHTTSPMQTDDSSVFDVSTKTGNATRADVSQGEKASRRPSEDSIQVSSSIEKQFFSQGIHLRSVNGKETTVNQRTTRNIVSTIERRPERQMLQSKITQKKEQVTSHRSHTTSVLQTENASEFRAPNATRADVLSKEKMSMGYGKLEVTSFTLSRSVQTKELTSLSKQQRIHTQRRMTKRNIHEGEHNLNTTVEQTTEEKLTTPQKKEGRSSHKPHTTFLQTESASELNVLTSATRADEKKTSKGHSLSGSFQTQVSTSHSEQQGISLRTTNSEDQTSNQRTKRNLPDSKHHLTTQEEVTTQKEQHKPTESSHKPNTASVLETETSSEFAVSTKPPSTTRAKEEKTSRGPSVTQETTQETPSSSIGPYDADNTNGELNTTHTTMETTNQPGPMTHAHTSSAITATTDLNKSVSTSGLKTTKREDVKWTSTQGPELRTSPITKSTKKLLTTKKTNKSNPPEKVDQKSNPGPAVAAVIGTTFVLMFIAIIFILVKKRKMQKRQLENPEWAGPSPFLDGEVQPNLTNMDNTENINRQGFSQMSIGRYLPSRLSKHLTLGKNTSDEVLMGDIMQGSTFGRQAADEVQAPNGNPKVSQDPTESEQNQSQEDQKPVDSSDAKTNASESAQEPVMESKEANQTKDVTASLPKIKHPPPLVSIDLDSFSEEAAPFQISDGGIAPPAPPLP